MQLITYSRLSTYQRCPREHRLRYQDRLRPKTKEHALGFGSLVHAGLESWWTHHSLDDAIDAMTRAAGTELDEFDIARASAMMTGYNERWLSVAESYEVLAVEQAFVAPLVNPVTGHPSRTYRLAGKIDAIARDRSTGHIWIIEHKTTSSPLTPGSLYWERLRLDAQISTYVAGAASLGYEVFGCIYDVLRKPPIKPLMATPETDRRYTQKASRLKDGTERPAGSLHAGQREYDETPGEYQTRILESIASDPDAHYRRGEVIRLDEDMREYARDTWDATHMLQVARRRDSHPRNPNACERYGRLCSYFDLCTGSSDATDDTRWDIAPSDHDELHGIGLEKK